MQNQVITNKQPSVLDMSPMQDAHGMALVLRPKGEKGDSKEISAEVAASEVVARVKKAGWVDLRPATPAHAAVPPPLPPPLPPPPEPAPAPVVVVAPPEPPQEMPTTADAALVEQTKAPESFETTTPPPAKPTRSRK